MLRRVENLLRHLIRRWAIRKGAGQGAASNRFQVGAISCRAPLGWNVSRRRHAFVPPLRQGHRPAARFHIHDRADAEVLIHVVPTELGLAKTQQRFPKKGDLHGHL